MPCADLRGTDYIDDCVRTYFKRDWPAALKAFVSDVDNLWCPKWLRRNYEIQNKTDVLDETDAVAPVDAADLRCQLCELPDKNEVTEPSRTKFPHADKLASNFEFGEDEPDDVEDTERPQPCCPTQWSKEHREPWQLHSGLGPNLHCETRENSPEPLPQVVNPPNHKWNTFHSHFKAFAPDVFWKKLRNSSTTYSDESLSVDALGDDYQQLFVRLVLDHCKGVLEAILKKTPPKPLRLFLLGTAGTGKTRSIQTLLQELQRLLEARKIPGTFVRVAAPTGSAAFNIRFGASTIHRLIP